MHHYPTQMRGEGNRALWDWDRWEEATSPAPPRLVYVTDSPHIYCYNDNPGEVNGKKAYESFINENDLKYHEQRTRYYISRYGYSTQIYEFEIMSEPWHLDQKLLNSTTGNNSDKDEPYFNAQNPLHDNVINAVGVYHRRIARYIKNTMGHYEHLVGVNAPTPAWEPDPSQMKTIDKSWTIDEVDIIGINPYNYTALNLLHSHINWEPDDLINPGYENSLFKLVRYFATSNSAHEKPVIISEGGHDATYSTCSDDKLEWVDNMTFGFVGACGFNLWHLKNGNKHNLWQNQVNVKNHMNGDDVISTLSNSWGIWRQSRSVAKEESSDPNEFIETQMYVSEDQTKAVGYVRNRTYNLSTQNVNGCGYFSSWAGWNVLEDISWNTDNSIPYQRVYATNLKNNTDYVVHWFRENSYMKSDCINSNLNGELRLEFPDLKVNPWYTGTDFNPVVWFVIKQENCQSGLAQNNEIGQGEEHALLNNEEERGLSVGSDYVLGLNPNPVSRTEDLTITSPFKQHVVFSNSQGMKIKESAVDEGISQLSLKDLDAGVYYLYFESSNKVIKLIVL